MKYTIISYGIIDGKIDYTFPSIENKFNNKIEAEEFLNKIKKEKPQFHWTIRKDK